MANNMAGDETNSPQQPFSQNGREVTPESHRPRPGTEHLPTIPTVDEMKSWGWEKVLQWVQQREPDLLKDDNLDNFKKADMMGRAFLLASAEFYVKYCSLTPDVSLELEGLMLEVKEGCKFIPSRSSDTSQPCPRPVIERTPIETRRQGSRAKEADHEDNYRHGRLPLSGFSSRSRR